MLRLAVVLTALALPLTVGEAAAPWCSGAGFEFATARAEACVSAVSASNAVECFRLAIPLPDQVDCAASDPSCHAEVEGVRCSAVGATASLWT